MNPLLLVVIVLFKTKRCTSHTSLLISRHVYYIIILQGVRMAVSMPGPVRMLLLRRWTWKAVIWGFGHDGDEICPLLGYNAASSGKGLPLDGALYPTLRYTPEEGRSQRERHRYSDNFLHITQRYSQRNWKPLAPSYVHVCLRTLSVTEIKCRLRYLQ
jgi:hypothetical protein